MIGNLHIEKIPFYQININKLYKVNKVIWAAWILVWFGVQLMIVSNLNKLNGEGGTSRSQVSVPTNQVQHGDPRLGLARPLSGVCKTHQFFMAVLWSLTWGPHITHLTERLTCSREFVIPGYIGVCKLVLQVWDYLGSTSNASLEME